MPINYPRLEGPTEKGLERLARLAAQSKPAPETITTEDMMAAIDPAAVAHDDGPGFFERWGNFLMGIPSGEAQTYDDDLGISYRNPDYSGGQQMVNAYFDLGNFIDQALSGQLGTPMDITKAAAKGMWDAYTDPRYPYEDPAMFGVDALSWVLGAGATRAAANRLTSLADEALAYRRAVPPLAAESALESILEPTTALQRVTSHPVYNRLRSRLADETGTVDWGGMGETLTPEEVAARELLSDSELDDIMEGVGPVTEVPEDYTGKYAAALQRKLARELDETSELSGYTVSGADEEVRLSKAEAEKAMREEGWNPDNPIPEGSRIGKSGLLLDENQADVFLPVYGGREIFPELFEYGQRGERIYQDLGRGVDTDVLRYRFASGDRPPAVTLDEDFSQWLGDLGEFRINTRRVKPEYDPITQQLTIREGKLGEAVPPGELPRLTEAQAQYIEDALYGTGIPGVETQAELRNLMSEGATPPSGVARLLQQQTDWETLLGQPGTRPIATHPDLQPTRPPQANPLAEPGSVWDYGPRGEQVVSLQSRPGPPLYTSDTGVPGFTREDILFSRGEIPRPFYNEKTGEYVWRHAPEDAFEYVRHDDPAYWASEPSLETAPMSEMDTELWGPGDYAGPSTYAGPQGMLDYQLPRQMQLETMNEIYEELLSIRDDIAWQHQGNWPGRTWEERNAAEQAAIRAAQNEYLNPLRPYMPEEISNAWGMMGAGNAELVPPGGADFSTTAARQIPGQMRLFPDTPKPPRDVPLVPETRSTLQRLKDELQARGHQLLLDDTGAVSLRAEDWTFNRRDAVTEQVESRYYPGETNLYQQRTWDITSKDGQYAGTITFHWRDETPEIVHVDSMNPGQNVDMFYNPELNNLMGAKGLTRVLREVIQAENPYVEKVEWLAVNSGANINAQLADRPVALNIPSRYLNQPNLFRGEDYRMPPPLPEEYSSEFLAPTYEDVAQGLQSLQRINRGIPVQNQLPLEWAKPFLPWDPESFMDLYILAEETPIGTPVPGWTRAGTVPHNHSVQEIAELANQDTHRAIMTHLFGGHDIPEDIAMVLLVGTEDLGAVDAWHALEHLPNEQLPPTRYRAVGDEYAGEPSLVGYDVVAPESMRLLFDEQTRRPRDFSSRDPNTDALRDYFEQQEARSRRADVLEIRRRT